MDQPITAKTKQQRLFKRTKSLLVASLAVIVVLYVVYKSLETSVSRDQIRTATVERKHLRTELTAGGLIVPINEESVVSVLDSHLQDVHVHAGQFVEAGQLLMTLDTTKQQLAIANMEEEMALLDNKILTSKLNMAKNINELDGRLELLGVDYESRQTRLKRLQQLAEIGGISKHDLTEAELNVKRSEIEIRQLRQRQQDTQASTTAEIDGLKLEQSILQKSLSEKQRLLAQAEVVAPRSGLIVWLNNEEGSAISIGQSLAKIADTSAFKVEANISDFYANQLWQGMKADFEYSNHVFSGQITSIVASDQQGILALTIALDEQDKNHKSLRQKQRVDVNLITGEVKDALVVAKGPFIKGAGIKKVFVVKAGVANRQEATIGKGNRHFYHIKQGLAEGDEVIISDMSLYENKREVVVNTP